MRRTSSAIIGFAFSMFLGAGCKKFNATGEASVEDDDGVEIIVVEVKTEPEAKVFLNDAPPSTESTKADYKGATALDWVIADSKGNATLRLPMWDGYDGENDLEIGVWRGKDLPFMRTPRFDFKVTVERKPSIQIKDGNVACVGKKCRGIVRKDLALVLEEVKDQTKGSIAGGVVVSASGSKLVATPDFNLLFVGNDVDNVFGAIGGQLTPAYRAGIF